MSFAISSHFIISSFAIIADILEGVATVTIAIGVVVTDASIVEDVIAFNTVAIAIRIFMVKLEAHPMKQ